VPDGRELEVLKRLARLSTGDGGPRSARLCEVAVEVTSVTGAGIMLIVDASSASSVCCSDAVATLVEELQFTLGEGPCIDASTSSLPVLEPDLAHPETPRWLAFAGEAVAAGVRGIFGYPLEVDHTRIGALHLYTDRPGPLTEDQHAFALVVASVAARGLLAMQDDAPAGLLAAELARGLDIRTVVHQAAGMISVQLEVDIDEAYVRLRAHAFAHDELLIAVSEAVVARELRLHGPEPLDDDAA
jgi:hypothetical protein